jgi:DNA-binding CsgD family transcriptional regulator
MHLANARRKLGALTREQAVAIAVARGIVSI